MSAIYVYPELETIFIHMPKCGGQSIQNYFQSITNSKKQFHGHIPEEYRNYWKFTVVRNPADRLISAWTYCQKMHWFPKPRILPRWKTSSSLHRFLKLLEMWKTRPVSPINFREFREDPEFMTLHHAAPMTHPDRCVDSLDYVGRFEVFPNVIEELSKRFGFKCDNQHINRTDHADFRNYYDLSLKKKVNQYFAKDFSRFCYPLLKLEAD